MALCFFCHYYELIFKWDEFSLGQLFSALWAAVSGWYPRLALPSLAFRKCPNDRSLWGWLGSRDDIFPLWSWGTVTEGSVSAVTASLQCAVRCPWAKTVNLCVLCPLFIFRLPESPHCSIRCSGLKSRPWSISSLALRCALRISPCRVLLEFRLRCVLLVSSRAPARFLLTFLIWGDTQHPIVSVLMEFTLWFLTFVALRPLREEGGTDILFLPTFKTEAGGSPEKAFVSPVLNANVLTLI